MTDNLDLAEEIATLRRTVAAHSVMLKQAMGEIEGLRELARRPHERLDALERREAEYRLRLQILEKWQLEVSEWQRARAVSPPIEPAPLQPYANDNNPGDYAPKSRAQVMRVLDELEDVMREHKRRSPDGDFWGLARELQSFLDAHRCG